jgi:hypothetical protein
MKSDGRSHEEGIHIKYEGRDAYWVDGIVLFVASAVALLMACLLVNSGISAAKVSHAMVWLSLPWFIGLYWLSGKLRKIAEKGFEIVLKPNMAPAYAAAIIAVVFEFVNRLK